jgi:hypothetical protein
MSGWTRRWLNALFRSKEVAQSPGRATCWTVSGDSMRKCMDTCSEFTLRPSHTLRHLILPSLPGFFDTIDDGLMYPVSASAILVTTPKSSSS